MKKFTDFFINVFHRSQAHKLTETAAHLAYFFLLSLFPFMILLNIAISALNISPDIIDRFISPILPKNIASLIIRYNNHISSISDTAPASLGIIFIIYSSSKAIRILNKTFLNTYGNTKKHSYIRSVLMALSATVCLLITAVLSIFFISLLLAYSGVIKSVCALILLSVSTLALNTIHYIAAPRKTKFINLLPGSIISVTAVCAASFAFAIYFHFSSFSIIYGALSTFMLLMLWLYAFSVLLISGAEINALLISGYTKSG